MEAALRNIITLASFANLYQVCRAFIIYSICRRYTMVKLSSFVSNMLIVAAALRRHSLREGCVIECGTWKGGMSAALVRVGGPDREYHFFDSFVGLPAPAAIDGPEALEWSKNTDGERYFNNCSASRAEFENTLRVTNSRNKNIHVHEGQFSETLEQSKISFVSILRLDADWYDSTYLCLRHFWDKLLPGAVIIIDDYIDWAGCRKALHDFMSERKLSEAIMESPIGSVFYIVKQRY